MMVTTRLRAANLIGFMVCAMLALGQPVQAQNNDRGDGVRGTFFQRLFNRRHRDSRYERRQIEIRQNTRRAIKPIRVSSPKIFTYKPDLLKRVSFAKLAEVKVANAEAPSREVAADATGLSASDAGSSASGSAPSRTGDVVLTSFDRARGHLSSISLRALSEVEAALTAHYTANPEFIWITDGRVNAKALAAIQVFRQAETFALARDDYRIDVPADILSTGTVTEIKAELPGGAREPGAAEEQSAASVSGDQDPASGADPAPASAAEAEKPAENQAAAASAEASDTGPTPAAEGRPSEERQKALMEFEMTMSATALTYVLDATRGRVDPNRLSGYHDLPRHEVDLDTVLETLAGADDVTATLEGAHPGNSRFTALKAELADLRGRDEEPSITIAQGTLIKPGQAHGELANVVAGIRLRGSQALKTNHVVTLSLFEVGDSYSPELVALVRDFQKESGLKPDGVIGANTIRAITGVTNADKITKVTLAMERLRWLPRELGERHVFINQPAYNVTYFEPGKDPLSMRVVVGKKSNQTNFFYDEIETVEYNPYWGVPLSIIVNEMMPKLRNDPFYLDNAGYEVTTLDGTPVSSASVDWYGVATKSVPINVRQPPGRQNALGSLKILFPNKHAIYMHDTPAKNLFSRDKRAYSHGCVRLQYPDRMAAAVLGTSTDYIASRIAGGRNESENVAHNIPVYSSYFTAWPTLEETIGYYDDVYGRDAGLLKALESTRAARHLNS